MLQITSKFKNNTTVIVFDKKTVSTISFLTTTAQNILTKKLKDGVKIISLSEVTQHYIFCPFELTDKKNINLEKLRILGFEINAFCKENKEHLVNFEVYGTFEECYTKAILLGFSLSNYEFKKYLKNKVSTAVTISVLSKTLSTKNVTKINTLTKSISVAKDLVNEPVSYLTAVQYSKEMQKIGKDAGIKVTVWNQERIEKEKMGGLIAVNKGSSAPATFTILEYKPAKYINAKPLVLVGKGVVYDTGGLSLKPTKNSMDLMKCDMAGSATVVGAMLAIAEAKLPYYIIGLVAAVENRPGYEACCPGDVITMYDGTTVEVLDTDAEGRLILADALHYAKRLNPELVLDFATLTGAAMRAIGREASVIMGTASKEIKQHIKHASKRTGERVVEFPFWDEYGDYMKSDIADLKNLGPAEAGAITAGKFLQHFTDYPWMHFDIAGPAFVTSPYNYRGKWATGYGIRLVYKFVENECKTKKK